MDHWTIVSVVWFNQVPFTKKKSPEWTMMDHSTEAAIYYSEDVIFRKNKKKKKKEASASDH